MVETAGLLKRLNRTQRAPADIAVLRLQNGEFGYLDGDDYRLVGSRKLICELTVSNGAVWDLNEFRANRISPFLRSSRGSRPAFPTIAESRRFSMRHVTRRLDQK